MFFLQVRDEFRFLQCGDISPSLTDPALLSVVGVVDGQVSGFITKETHLQHFLPLQSSDRHRPGLSLSECTGPGFSAFKASADRPAQKNATSDYGFDFVTPTPPPQCVERFHCYRSNEKNIIASLLKFAGYIHSHKSLSGNIFGLILKNKMAAMGVFRL